MVWKREVTKKLSDICGNGNFLFLYALTLRMDMTIKFNSILHMAVSLAMQCTLTTEMIKQSANIEAAIS